MIVDSETGAVEVLVDGAPIEVTIETATYEGGWKYAASADADDPEHARFVARHLWDEAYTGTGGGRRLTFTSFGPEAPDGVIVRTEIRP